MEKVSKDVVEKTFTNLMNLDMKETKKMMNKMIDEQPFILTYLAALVEDDEDFTEEGKDILFTLTMLIWQSMLSVRPDLPTVPMETIEEMEEKNLKILDSMEDISDDEFFEKTLQILDNYPQTELLSFISEYLMENENMVLDEDGLIFIYLKIIIDSFQKTSEIQEMNF